MSGEQQLERSVLERKERDELQQIASAMGLSPASRTSKANLVTQILRATGVEEDGGAEDKPKRTRKKAEPAAAAASDGAAPDGPSGGGGAVATAVEPTDAAASGKGPEAPAQAPSSNGNGRTEAPPRRSTELGAPPAEARAEEPAASNGAGSADAGSAPSSESEGETQAQPKPSQGRDGQSQQPQGRDRDGQGQQNRDGQGQGRDREGQGQQNRDGQGRQQQHQQQNRQQQQFDGGGQAEPGNRRNRRRRGRDRERGPGGGGGGVERDLQGGGQEQAYSGEPVPVAGLLDLRDEGFGFLRTSGYLSSAKDVYVSISQVRRFALRKGDYVEGASRPAATNEKYPALLRIDTVSGMTPDEARVRPRFEDLTPLFPDEKLRLEMPGDTANMTARIVDLISPIGKGQRGLIVSPPKAGKTTVLKQIAHSIEANNPEVFLMVLLVDERPEEVTDMRRSVERGEVVASTFDRPSDEHTQVAELTIERAKRLVEVGKDVVIVLDGITRLARAYNLAAPATGRIMSGGIDTGALYPPKKFFGAARNIEEGGSLTILATALVETGSRMDEVIFEEFKGTGNMELRLDRRLAEKRIYPAIDVNASSTRHEELLFERIQLQQVWKLRRVLNALAADGSSAPGLELLIDKIKSTRSNDEFLAEIAKGPTPPV
jgi:transcription termination factor Rho